MLQRAAFGFLLVRPWRQCLVFAKVGMEGPGFVVAVSQQCVGSLGRSSCRDVLRRPAATAFHSLGSVEFIKVRLS